MGEGEGGSEGSPRRETKTTILDIDGVRIYRVDIHRRWERHLPTRFNSRYTLLKLNTMSNSQTFAK